jgi:hypothetical protein
VLKGYIVVFDFETSSKFHKKAQILSLASKVINVRNLTVVEDSEFYTLVRPENVDAIESEALEKNKLTIAELTDEKVPSIEAVWHQWVSYLSKYKTGKGVWDNPIAGGFNILGYDLPIVQRYAERFGTVDKEGNQALFHPRDKFDLLDDITRITWCNPQFARSKALDVVRRWMGIPLDGAHNALVDVDHCVDLTIKFLKTYRWLANKNFFENSYNRNAEAQV